MIVYWVWDLLLFALAGLTGGELGFALAGASAWGCCEDSPSSGEPDTEKPPDVEAPPVEPPAAEAPETEGPPAAEAPSAEDPGVEGPDTESPPGAEDRHAPARRRRTRRQAGTVGWRRALETAERRLDEGRYHCLVDVCARGGDTEGAVRQIPGVPQEAVARPGEAGEIPTAGLREGWVRVSLDRVPRESLRAAMRVLLTDKGLRRGVLYLQREEKESKESKESV